MSDDGPAASSSDGSTTPPTRWGLWVRGRIRTSVVLGDGSGEHVADLSLHGWPRRRRRLRAATDEDEWTVTVEPGRLSVDCEGDRRMSVWGDEAHLDGRRFTWEVYDGGLHRGTFRDPDDGPVVMDVAPAGGGEDEPVAVIAVAGDLPDPLPVVLAACAVQLVTRPRGSMSDGMDPGAGVDIVSPF